MNKPPIWARPRFWAIGVLSVVSGILIGLFAMRLGIAPTPGPERDPGPGPTTSAMPSPRALPSDDAAVALPAGTDLQEIIDEHPAGTRYRIGSGLHREQQLVPKPGDVFVGEAGAVLSGARDISADAVGWERDGRWWALEDQTQEGEEHGQIDDDGNPRHARPEELFVDDERFEHVAAPDQLGPGRWYFDYPNDRILLGEDPSGLGLIETSVTPAAIAGEGIDDVTVSGVTVEKYANRSSFGAIDGLNASGWQIRDCTARNNHGAGVSVGPGGLIEGCDVYGNGQIGVKVVGVIRRGEREGESAPVTISRNNIHDNRTLDYSYSWEAGALKIAECRQGVLFEDNWVHDNDGPGPWFDVYNYSATIRGNLVENNTVRGIFYELSYGPTTISDNIVRHNGDPDNGVPFASGIFVSSSRDVTVEDNIVYDNAGGGITARTAGDRDPLVHNLMVRNNQIAFTSGVNGIVADRGAPPATFDDFGNRFEDNRYWAGSAGNGFAWDGSSEMSWEQWQAAGNDAGGAIAQGPDHLHDTTSTISTLRFGAQEE